MNILKRGSGLAIVVIACVISGGCSSDRTAGFAQQPSKQVEQFRPISEVTEDIRELMVDLAEHNAAEYLTGKIMLLTSQGAQTAGGKTPDTGNLWITDSKVGQPDPNHIKIEIQGRGWKWIERETESLAATFEIGQVVTFEMDMSAVGTFDMVYDPAWKILTVYFVPTEPIQTEFTVISEINVITDSLWSSIVGQAAPIVGKSLPSRAQEKIKARATHRITEKLKHGFTLIVDMCNSNYYTKFGTFPAGKLPEPASAPKQKNFQINSAAVLYENSLLMAGPFDPGKKPFAAFQNTGQGSFEAYWVCREDARQLVHSYMENRKINITNSLSSVTIGVNQTIEFPEPADVNCPLVLVMKPLSDTPVRYNYEVSLQNQKPEPLVNCPR